MLKSELLFQSDLGRYGYFNEEGVVVSKAYRYLVFKTPANAVCVQI